MAAASEAANREDGVRLRRKCHELIRYAEILKSKLAKSQSLGAQIISEASRLHGNDFPPWTSTPRTADFAIGPGGTLYK